MNGDVVEYDRDEKELSRSTFVDGKHLIKVIGWHTLGQKEYEGFKLHDEGMPNATYDWWQSTVTTVPAATPGPDQKHGLWVSWYPNGSKQTRSQYDHDVRVGKFQWWYENGQPQAEGDYDLGKKIGSWITWHPNGQKESLANYQNDQLVGQPMHWDADGKLVEGQGSNYRQPTPAAPQQPDRTGVRYSGRTR